MIIKKQPMLFLNILNILVAVIWIAVCLKEHLTDSLESSHLVIAGIWSFAGILSVFALLKHHKKSGM